MTPYDILLQICRERKSTRTFLSTPVADETIEKILAIARTTPYASGKKNWGVLVLRNRAVIERILLTVQQKATELKANMREDFQDGFAGYAENFTAFHTAPVLLIPTFRVAPALSFMLQEKNESIMAWENDTYVKSISCVCMLILLACQALQLGACYMTGPLIAQQEILQCLDALPEHKIAALIPIGYN